MKARLPLIAALAATLAPIQASAQAWVPNPDLSEGPGIRAGNLELHPSIGAEAGYDSNFFRASKSEGVVDVYKFRVTPSISLNTLGNDRRGGATGNVAFSAAAFASYFEPVAADSANSDVSRRRNVGVGADAKLHIFPKRKLGFDMSAAYVRVIEAEGRSDDLAGEGFNRDTIRAGAGASWRPGGGAFEWRLGYNFTDNLFESGTYTSLDNVHHDFVTQARWRFLPRSAFLSDSTYSLIRYTHNQSQQTNGDAIRARLGFHGLVTYHLSLLGMVGWASSFYQTSEGTIRARQFDSLLGNAEARWFIQARPDLDAATVASGLTSIALGYARTFNNSYFGSFYQRDRGYLTFDMFILGAVVAGLELGVSRVGYPDVSLPGGPSIARFSQLRIDGRAFAEYRVAENFGLNATVLYDQVNSPVVNGEELKFYRWQGYVGVRYFW